MDIARLIADRSRAIDASGIRRVFDLGKELTDPINLSIGQPDFPVPDPIKQAAIDAINNDHNGYTVTQGVAALRTRLREHLKGDVGWDVGEGSPTDLLVTAGTSGALVLASMCLLNPGDEMIIPDPYFVMYPNLAKMVGARAVFCDVYPDFIMTAERVEPLISPKTKIVMFNSPANPTGAVATRAQCRDLLDLCRARNVLLISDEIYDEFTYREARTDEFNGRGRCPSPARFENARDDVLLVRGFGKTYGVTGWRMGYCAGPRDLINELGKLQQFTFTCAPSMSQHGCIAALGVDMSDHIEDYQSRRGLVLRRLREVTEVSTPGGAFYVFAKIPDRLHLTGAEFVERCIERNVLIIPGNVFSRRDTHFRLSFATKRDSLERGLDVLVELMR